MIRVRSARSPVVERLYRPDARACASAIGMLLKKEGGPETAPDDARRKVEDACTKPEYT